MKYVAIIERKPGNIPSTSIKFIRSLRPLNLILDSAYATHSTIADWSTALKSAIIRVLRYQCQNGVFSVRNMKFLNDHSFGNT